MDLCRTVREIDLFETGINLSRVVGNAKRVLGIAVWLHDFGKVKNMFLTPKTGLTEEPRKILDETEELISIIPFLISITILDLIL